MPYSKSPAPALVDDPSVFISKKPWGSGVGTAVRIVIAEKERCSPIMRGHVESSGEVHESAEP